MISKRAPVAIPSRATTWAKMERRGDFTIVLREPSSGTETRIKHDYDLLYWATRQLDQWQTQLRAQGKEAKLEDAKRDFAGTILVGDDRTVPYVTDEELSQQLHRWQAPSIFAKKMIALRWKFTDSTVATIVNRTPKAKAT